MRFFKRARYAFLALSGCFLAATIAFAQDFPASGTNFDSDSLPTVGGEATNPPSTPEQYRLPLKWLLAANGDMKSFSDSVRGLASQQAEAVLKDSIFSKFDRTEFSLQVGKGKPVFNILTVQPVYESDDLADTLFAQGSVFGYDGRTTVNLGLGYRRMLLDEKLLAGVNAFFDHEFPKGHQRSSLGLELRSSVAELNVNRYFALTGWRDDRSGGEARSLPGHDVELGATLPYLPYVKAYAKAFRWYSYDGEPDVKGATYSLAGYVLPGVQIEAGRTDYSTAGNADENFLRLTYTLYLEKTRSERFSKPFVTTAPYSLDSMKEMRLDKVRRENRIFKQKRNGFQVTASGF